MILLVIIGIILLIASFALKDPANPLFKFSKVIRNVAFVVLLLGVFSSMFKQIDGEDGFVCSCSLVDSFIPCRGVDVW